MLYRFLFEIGWLCFAALVAPANVKGILLTLAIFFLLRLLYGRNTALNKKGFRVSNIIAAVIVSLILEIVFYNKWKKSSLLHRIDHLLSLKEGFTAAAAGICLCIFFVYTLLYILKSVQMPADAATDKASKVSRKEKVLLAFISVGMISIFSKSSVLYPFNDWVDANSYMTVGKSILHGLVPYRDLFEQKGPILYFIHALAALISDTSFIGMYFVEMVACWFFLYFSYKILSLYCVKHKISCVLLSAVIIYGSKCFAHGDSVEELVLPFLAAMIYIGLRTIKKNEPFSNREALYVGISAGIILWMKFTILGLYLGWGLYFIIYYLHKKWGKRLIKAIFFVVLGLVIVTIPVLLYFIFNHALKDLFQVYFYDNIFHYTAAKIVNGNETSSVNIFRNIIHDFEANLIYFSFIYIGLVLNICFSKKRSVFLLLCYVTTAFFTFIGAGYYNLALAVFVPVGVGFIDICCFSKKQTSYISLIIVAVLCLVVGSQGQNLYLLGKSKDTLVQYSFAKIIDASSDRTLLNYRFLDGGFYTTADVVPTVKYFMVTNGMHTESQKAQDQYVKEEKTEFVVTRSLNEQNYPVLSEHYHLVAKQDGFFEVGTFHYCLYQRNN